jgi:hypothetical protein
MLLAGLTSSDPIALKVRVRCDLPDMFVVVNTLLQGGARVYNGSNSFLTML